MENKYFYGNKISDYGMENGKVDYHCLAECFDAVLNNDIISKTSQNGYIWDIYNGSDYDEENDTYTEIYQFYIIDETGVRILTEHTNEIIYYCEELDLYVWCVDHWGTSWDYVLTDIEID